MKTTKELLDFYGVEVGKIYKVISAKSIQNSHLVGSKFFVDLVNDSIILKFQGGACMFTLLNEICYTEAKNILTDDEKIYLKTIIKPFRDRVKSIRKTETGNIYDGGEVMIFVLTMDEVFRLPELPQYEMFNGMEQDKKYTLDDLGI